MRPTLTASTASGRTVIEIDEAAIHRALWVVALVALILVALTLSGWFLTALALGIAAAYGITSIRNNEQRRDFPAPLNDAWIAVIDALADNGLAVNDTMSHDVTQGDVRAGDVRARVELHPGGISRVRVRAGRFDFADNRRRAALVLERVVANLEPRIAAKR